MVISGENSWVDRLGPSQCDTAIETGGVDRYSTTAGPHAPALTLGVVVAEGGWVDECGTSGPGHFGG
jgi:hypothetical protein